MAAAAPQIPGNVMDIINALHVTMPMIVEEVDDINNLIGPQPDWEAIIDKITDGESRLEYNLVISRADGEELHQKMTAIGGFPDAIMEAVKQQMKKIKTMRLIFGNMLTIARYTTHGNPSVQEQETDKHKIRSGMLTMQGLGHETQLLVTQIYQYARFGQHGGSRKRSLRSKRSKRSKRTKRKQHTHRK